MSDLSLIIIKKSCESLNQIIVGDLISKWFSEICKVFGKGKSYFPWLVLTSGKKGSKGMDLVLFFR